MSVSLRSKLQALGYSAPQHSHRPAANLERLAASMGGEVRQWRGDPVVVVEDVVGAPLARVSESSLALIAQGVSPDRMCFLDTETTGLSGGVGTQAFLCALAWRVAGGVLVRQYLLPDPSYEAAMLGAITDDLEGCGALVTYNGRSFDAPLLQSRLLMCRLDPGMLARPHIDLLHSVRRIYRARLPSCSLGSIESVVLDRDRGDDIPGHLIPPAYFDYLRSGETEGLRPVLTHNRQDVVSLSLLLDHLGRVLDDPGRAHPLDRFGIAGLLRASRPDDSLTLYEALWEESVADAWDGEPWPPDWNPVELAYRVGLKLAVAHRRGGRAALGRPILEALCRSHPRPVEAGIMLAKHLEHRERDRRGALGATRDALAACRLPREPAATKASRGNPEPRWLADLDRRQQRLTRALRVEPATV